MVKLVKKLGHFGVKSETELFLDPDLAPKISKSDYVALEAEIRTLKHTVRSQDADLQKYGKLIELLDEINEPALVKQMTQTAEDYAAKYVRGKNKAEKKA